MSTLVRRSVKGTTLTSAEEENNNAITVPFTDSKTAAYTVLTTDEGKLLLCDATSGAFTVTLPTVASAGDGFAIRIKKTDSSLLWVTIDGNGAETIDGVATYVLRNQYDSVHLVCDGTEWHVTTIGQQLPDCSGMMIGQSTNNATATTITALDTYYPIAGTWTSIQTRGIGQTLATGTSTVAKDGDYICTCDISVISSRSTVVVTGGWLVNGSLQGPRVRHKLGTGSDVVALNLYTKLVGLSAGDTIQFGLTMLTGEGGTAGDTITAENGAISITECPG
jgi:hypothetical protein